jgi:hypothetical protein
MAVEPTEPTRMTGKRPWYADRKEAIARMAKARAAKGKGTRVTKPRSSFISYPGNGNTPAARRFRDLLKGFVSDMGLTEKELTPTQKMQLRHAALIAVQIETLQAKLANGEHLGSKPTRNQIALQNSLDRKLWCLGIGKRRRQDFEVDALDYAEKDDLA